MATHPDDRAMDQAARRIAGVVDAASLRGRVSELVIEDATRQVAAAIRAMGLAADAMSGHASIPVPDRDPPG